MLRTVHAKKAIPLRSSAPFALERGSSPPSTEAAPPEGFLGSEERASG